MRGRWRIGVMGVALSVLAVAAHAAIAEEAKPYIGEWAVVLEGTGSSFNASWLKVLEKGDALDMRMLWRFGSVTPVKSVTVREGALVWVRPEFSETLEKEVDTTYTAKLVGEELVGQVRMPNNAVHTFTGVRERNLADLAGTWVPAEGAENSRLVLKQDGEKVTGTFFSEGEQAPIENARLEGQKLTFEIPQGDSRIKVEATFAGDKISGSYDTGSDSGTFTGRRLRKRGDTTVLFDGRILAGWKPRDGQTIHWDIGDGWASPKLAQKPGDPAGQDIYTEAKFDDFILHVEYMFPKLEKVGYYNSGIYVRGRYEVQLLSDAGKGVSEHGTGAIYSRTQPTANASKPLGETQTIDITLVGKHITVVVNGTTVVDNAYLEGITGGALDPWEDEPGPVMLQAHGQPVKFGKVELTPLLKE